MKKTLLKLLLPIFLLVSCEVILAQGEANVWYFGSYAGLDFNTSPPTPLINGSLSTSEGCASICNKNGQLLFYSDGIRVWNKNHVVMPNGNGTLLGNPSSTQSAIIVPKPGTYNMATRAYDNYYIVTVDFNGGISGVRYSEVNLTLNGGLGDVVLANRNTHLYGTSTSERICIVKHSNGCDFWVIGRNVGEVNFRSYLINSSGFSATPVFSTVARLPCTATIGSLKASSNNLMIADVHASYAGPGGGLYVYDFNNTTGVLTDKFSDNTVAATQEYSPEFSPDNTKLYYTVLQQPNIYQYDLTVGTNPAFVASRQIIGATTPPNLGAYTTAALQLGPDKKIYVALNGKTSLGVINDPNQPGAACNYVDQAVSLAGRTSILGLPALTTSLIQDKIDILNSKVCNSITNDFNFTLSSVTNVNAINWLFIPQANPSNTITATGTTALVTFPAVGVYTVSALISYNCFNDIVTTTVNIAPMPTIDAGNTQTICAGASASLTATLPPDAFNLQWQPSASLNSYTITNPVATPNATTIYTVSSQVKVGSNLVTNGEFESGATGFTTQYSQSPSNQALGNPGSWSIGNTITNAWWASCMDHTPGAGTNMMFLDGADGSSSVPVNANCWCQAVSVQPNTDYVFSAWLTNGNASGATSQLLFSVNGNPISSPINTPIGSCTWNQFSSVWNSGTNTSITICISEASGAQPGNDFAIDDITFYQLCTITDTVRVHVNPLPVITANTSTICIGQQTATLTANGATTYTWAPSTGLSAATGSVVTASPTVSTTYTIQGVSGSCVGTGTTSVKVNFLPSVYILQKNSTCDTTVLNWLNVTSVTPTLAQGYLPSGLTVNATHSNGGMSTTPSMFSGAVFPATYSVPIGATTIRNDLGGTFNFCFNQPVINPQIAFASIGNPSNPVTINTSSPYQVIWPGLNMTYPSPTSLIGAEGFTIIRFPGVHTCVSLDYIGDESYCNLAFGVMDADCQGKPICPGDPVELLANGASSYAWNTGATTSTITPTPSVTTTYSVVGINSAGCINTSTTSVVVNPAPIVTVNSSTICLGQQTATLTAGGAITYTWSTTATTQSITQSPAVTTAYTVTGTDANNCVKTATASILVNPLPVVTTTASAICLGQQTATLTASGAQTYTWSTMATTSSIALSPTVTTTYTVAGTDVNNCINTSSTSITVYALPTASFTADSVCYMTSTHLLDASNGNGSPLTNYAWDFTMDGIIDIFGVANPTYQFTNPGSTSVNYTVSSTPLPGLVCTSTITKNIWVHPLPLPDFTTVNKCINNQPNTFDATPSLIAVGTNTLYNWSYGDGANGSGLTSNHIYTNATVYTVTLTVTSDKGCIGTTTGQTEVYPKPSMSVLAGSNVCLGQAMTFTAVSLPSGGTVINWFWDFNNNISTIETNGQTVNYTFASTGTKTVSLVSQSDKGCRDTLSRQVYINYVPNPLFTVDNPAGCAAPRHCLTLTDTTRQIPGPAQNTERTWVFGDGNSNAAGGANEFHCYGNNSSSQLATYAVKLIIKTDSGCVNSLEKQNYITVYPQPVASYQIINNPGTIIEPFVQFVNQSQDYTAWMWNFGDATTPDVVNVNPTHLYNSESAKTYYSYLTVANQYGCKDSVFVPVEIKPEFVFYIPNAFSPYNKDDVNDLFTGTGIGIAEYEMWVYDRWGRQLYYTKDITQGWNGKGRNNGDYVKQDVYVWKVIVKDVLGKFHEYTGHVTVL